MTKMTELIADPNTNLTAVVAGDYVLVYDVSEPLDTRKVKVIPVSDFANSINPPAIYRRVGGNATDYTNWFASNIYSPTKAKMQLGFGVLEFSNSSDLYANLTVTFPASFDDKPIVIPFSYGLSLDAGMTMEAIPLTATTCRLGLRKYVGSGSLSYVIGYLAIGDITA